MKLKSIILVLASSCALAHAHANDYRQPGGIAPYAEPAIAAGFRTLFTCSAHFWAGRALDDIITVELRDTDVLGMPPPFIDERRALVRQTYGDGRTRTAVFRPSMGCTILPLHWSEAQIPDLPGIELPPPPDLREQPFPAGDLAHPRPGRKLRAVLNDALDGRTYGEGTITAGVVIVEDRHIVAETYGDGFGIHTGYRTWSTAKSISATLIGIAADGGVMDLDAPAPIPEWNWPGDARHAITPKHLLWMSSGLWSEGANTNAVYFGGQDAISSATGTPLEVEPNTRWKYANNDTLALLRGLRAALGDDHGYLRFPYDKLLHRIGMYHTRMETDHLGNFIGSSQVYTTARDLARFGLLYLNDGRWEGDRILPEGWTRFVSTPAPATRIEGFAATGQHGYGAQFWLFDNIDGIPPDTYTTAGNKGQYATIVPARNLVIVRTGVDPQGLRWNHVSFVKDVLATL
ncbi:MAG: serine hydrolase [Pseudomonadales bacterium]|jgi:CubicO group peptidase (beta-lactamase class C family)|nr:serine hydrolase [Pseudomonadales bacterium]MDP6828532.1 serine hydrolase [Pseudomonadales bacterium]MDP6973139.1 serine hydrolase [Pseudomonadales bacterium]